jgi:hypothetical protein
MLSSVIKRQHLEFYSTFGRNNNKNQLTPNFLAFFVLSVELLFKDVFLAGQGRRGRLWILQCGGCTRNKNNFSFHFALLRSN